MGAPRWAHGLLRFVAPKHRTDDVLGDLEEAHRRRRERRGAALSALLTTLDALDMAFALVRQRSTDRSAFSPLDFKLGFRMLVRYPGLTLVGGLSMALAIGLGAAAFEAINEAAGARRVGARGRPRWWLSTACSCWASVCSRPWCRHGGRWG